VLSRKAVGELLTPRAVSEQHGAAAPLNGQKAFAPLTRAPGATIVRSDGQATRHLRRALQAGAPLLG
jgi:hypothetical protein